MRIALVNPPWAFEGSIYFGCREPHLPLEYGYAQALLGAAGHEARIFDAHAEALGLPELAGQVGRFAPEMIVVTTAPSYLFWRCAPPELRVPQLTLGGARRHRRSHDCGRSAWLNDAASDAAEARRRCCDHGRMRGGAAFARRNAAPALGRDRGFMPPRWRRHRRPGRAAGCRHGPPAGLALAVPDPAAARASSSPLRPAPLPAPAPKSKPRAAAPITAPSARRRISATAIAAARSRTILDELDGLIAAGATYVYFIDEIFLPWRELLEELAERPVEFGVQTRIDLWRPDMLDLLGRAGCVSIEAGVESLDPGERNRLDKDCRLSTDQLTERLVHAKRSVPFVQANLIASGGDDPTEIARWREALSRQGVWANEPVPLFPYPGSPDYRRLWGLPDDNAWERALDWYLDRYAAFSDIQEARPLRLAELELS